MDHTSIFYVPASSKHLPQQCTAIDSMPQAEASTLRAENSRLAEQLAAAHAEMNTLKAAAEAGHSADSMQGQESTATQAHRQQVRTSRGG